jgi:hypothetical protein
MKDLIIEKLYELSKKPYQRFFKKNIPWSVSKKQLLSYSQESLGFSLGCFLLKHDFEMQEKFEDHDVMHVLTNTGVSTVQEIGMQFYLYGNGKQSAYLLMVMVTGLLFYPFQINYFLEQYRRGKKAFKFHHLDFSKMLHLSITTLQYTFNIR